MKRFVFVLALATLAVAPVNFAYAEKDAHACDKIQDAKEKAHCMEEQAKGKK